MQARGDPRLDVLQHADSSAHILLFASNDRCNTIKWEIHDGSNVTLYAGTHSLRSGLTAPARGYHAVAAAVMAAIHFKTTNFTMCFPDGLQLNQLLPDGWKCSEQLVGLRDAVRHLLQHCNANMVLITKHDANKDIIRRLKSEAATDQSSPFEMPTSTK
jgi:hypothetical protein